MPTETVLAAVEILGAQAHVDGSVEKRVRNLVSDDMTMRRLVDVTTEAFGLVVVSHLPGASELSVSDCFYAKDDSGEWRSFPVSREPIFVTSIEIAQQIFHDGPQTTMETIAARSGLLDAVINALDNGAPLSGSKLDGPKFHGLPAWLYEPGEQKPPD